MNLLRRAGAGAAAAAAGALLLAACGGTTSSHKPSTSASSASSSPTSVPASAKKKGGTATYAELPGSPPNYIFPFESTGYFSVTNGNLQDGLYRPLYWFGLGATANLNPQLSLAYTPTFKGRQVTIKLKDWKWSDGEPVQAKDVVFWLHMMQAEKSTWAAYVKGAIPDNITSIKVDNPHQLTLTLNASYSSYWYTYNELSQITPLPMAWDKTSMSAKAGSGGCTASASKCPAVYKFLDGQAKKLTTYATNPLWQVVDGPWKLQSFNSDGNVSFVPNPKYSGSPKPSLSVFKLVPFTSDSSEFNVLRAGTSISVGYIPPQDLPKKSPGGNPLPPTNPLGSSYTLAPAYAWAWPYALLNYNSPSMGPVFKQLYFRQALQMTVDQRADVAAAFRGYGFPTNGPVPLLPKTKWLSPLVKKGLYPFDLAKAKSLLSSHGWSMQGGVMTCTKPGSGSGQCGTGIPAGKKLNISLFYSNGSASFTQMMANWKSDASKAGINISLSSVPFDTVISKAVICTPKQPICSWQAAYYGEWIYSPDYEPTGGEILKTGATSNSQNYSNPTMDSLINLTHHSSALQDFYRYEDFTARQLPVINIPLTYTVATIVKGLKGVTPFNPLGTVTPEYWYYTK
jgi:peptide/nickel transport system substrate-binding protein